jgi:KUP system potassium uptake protein
VVYGDIGTSPLYALRECFHGEHGIVPSHDNVLGVLSLVFWALIIIISIKYLVFVMRADNRGEGGILALTSLVPHDLREHGLERRWLLTALSLFGAALLYGDGMITPAISVLSAVEGLETATPFFNPYVVPITLVILFALFLIQRRGTAGIGKLFGPVMILWFVTIGVLGFFWVIRVPSVLAAVNPWHAARFFLVNRGHGFLVLGSVFLVVTGGESLYADMGHFGRRPIRIAWFALVLPSLLLCYFGQGALLVTHQDAAAQPFYEMVRRLAPVMLYPMVVLSTAAAIIASQAVISGAFSLTRQAVQLGYIPRIEIVHTSNEEIGQIYIPSINWLLMLATFGLVLGFQKSTNLAAAYGVAVTNAMVITTLIGYVVARHRWRWSRLVVAPVAITFLLIDSSFFASNIIKVPDGGWFPLLVGVVVYTLMSTWKRGRQILAERLAQESLPLDKFVENIRPDSPIRVPGTAIFLSRDPTGVPTALLHNLKHNKVLHSRVMVLTMSTEEVPTVPPEERLEVQSLGKEFYRVITHYGFMQNPGVPEVLELLKEKGIELDEMSTTFFLSRETLIASKEPGMAIWREKLFALMVRNAQRPTDFFRIPVNRVVELGMQVRL